MLCKNILVKYQNWLKIEIFGYFIHSILEMFLGNINKEPKRESLTIKRKVQISIWENQNRIVRGCRICINLTYRYQNHLFLQDFSLICVLWS